MWNGLAMDAFPAAPTGIFDWLPIFLEPMDGSGERIVFAIVAYDAAGWSHVEVTLSEVRLQCMYGGQADAIAGLIELAAESVVHHMEACRSIEGWVPPFVGCFTGVTRKALAETPRDAAELGCKLVASLWKPEASQLREAREARAGMDAEQWLLQIRAEVVSSNPALEERFNREVRVKDGASPTRVGYLGIKIAANFDSLVPSNMTMRRQRAKSKLMDLQALRRQDQLLNTRNAYELILWLPEANSTSVSVHQIEQAHAAFLELEEFADREELIVRKMHDPVQAAARILHAEAA